MKFISRKSKLRRKCTDKEFAMEIVEIFEEKLEDGARILCNISDNSTETIIKDKVKQELIYEIEEFITGNKKKLVEKVA